MNPQQREMTEITRGLPSKSEKIRRLGARGYTRQQIADFLGIRYQHVRNVLIDAERKAKLTAAPASRAPQVTEDFAERGASFGGPSKVVTDLVVAPDGTLTIPRELMSDVQFKPGDRITLVKEGEGHIEVLSVWEGLRYAQDLIAKYIPAEVSLVDELFKMRREEVEKEEQEYREMQERLRRR